MTIRTPDKAFERPLPDRIYSLWCYQPGHNPGFIGGGDTWTCLYSTTDSTDHILAITDSGELEDAIGLESDKDAPDYVFERRDHPTPAALAKLSAKGAFFRLGYDLKDQLSPKDWEAIFETAGPRDRDPMRATEIRADNWQWGIGAFFRHDFSWQPTLLTRDAAGQYLPDPNRPPQVCRRVKFTRFKGIDWAWNQEERDYLDAWYVLCSQDYFSGARSGEISRVESPGQI